MKTTTKPSALTDRPAEEPLLPAAPANERGTTKRILRMLAPSQIVRDPEFAFRREATPDRAFTRTLAQALRTGGVLEAILVWEEEENGVPTGRLVLLDGVQRLATYRSVRGPNGNQKPIPVQLISGDRHAATLIALIANSRDRLPLTMQEKADAAWRLVRDVRTRFTVPETASAAAISPRTVDSMRKRWKAMQVAKQVPSGEWWRDRQDAPPDFSQEPEMTDEQRNAIKNELANALRKALGSWPNRDSHLVAEAVRAAIGNRELRNMSEYLYGAGEEEEDEFYNQPIVCKTDTARDANDDF